MQKGIKMKNRIIGRDIHIVANKIKRKMDSAIAEFNITHTQFHIMMFIAEQKESIYQRDIENAFNLRRSTISKILSLLENKQLIKRICVPSDARLKEIMITAEGIDCLDKVSNTFNKINNNLLKSIDKDELEIFYKVLNQLSDMTN